MEEWMQEPYAEGLATRGDPKPCSGTREGDGEASVGAHAGRVLSREIGSVRSADAVLLSGRQHDRKRNMRADGRLCAVEDPSGMRGTSMRENREVRWSLWEMVPGPQREG